MADDLLHNIYIYLLISQGPLNLIYDIHKFFVQSKGKASLFPLGRNDIYTKWKTNMKWLLIYTIGCISFCHRVFRHRTSVNGVRLLYHFKSILVICYLDYFNAFSCLVHTLHERRLAYPPGGSTSQYSNSDTAMLSWVYVWGMLLQEKVVYNLVYNSRF